VLILIAEFPYVETVSDILQVISFQLTGRRIFKMAPLHHHFELSGMSETAITWGSGAQAVFALLAFSLWPMQVELWVGRKDVAPAANRDSPRKQPDYILFFAILTLVAIGEIMVFSASMVRSIKWYGIPTTSS
jgi:hypothetical protein